MARRKKPNSITDIVEKICGQPADKDTIQIIKDYIAHDDKRYQDGKKYPIFKNYLMEREKLQRKTAAIFRSEKLEESKRLVTNILILHSLFGKELIVKKLIHSGLIEEVKNELNLVEAQLKSKFNAYYYWIHHFEKFKELLSQGIQFEQQNIDTLLKQSQNQEQVPDFLKSHFQGTIQFQKSHLVESINALNLHAIRLIESLEKSAVSQQETPDNLAEQAKYYVQLKEFGVAEKMLDQILKDSPEHSQAWYLKALIYLHRSQKAKQEFLEMNLLCDEGFQEEQWYGDARDSAADEYSQNESKALDVLLKAVQFWPLVHQDLYEDEPARSSVILTMIGLIRNKISGSFTFTLTRFANKNEAQKVENEVILSVFKEVMEFDNKAKGSPRYHLQRMVGKLLPLDLSCLSLYEKLDPENYQTYFQHWWEKYGQWECRNPESIKNPSFIIQIQKNFSLEECKEFLKDFSKEIKNQAELDTFNVYGSFGVYLTKANSYYLEATRSKDIQKYQDCLNSLFQGHSLFEVFRVAHYAHAQEPHIEAHNAKELYLLIRVAYDLAVIHAERENYDNAVTALWIPFEFKQEILIQIAKTKKHHQELEKKGKLYSCHSKLGYLVPEQEGDEYDERNYEADLFGNEGSVLEAEGGNQTSKLQDLIAQLKQSPLTSDNLKKLEDIEKHINHYSNNN